MDLAAPSEPPHAAANTAAWQILASHVLASAREHRILLVLASGYVAAGGLTLAVLGRPWPIELTTSWFLGAWLALSALWLAWEFLSGRRRLQAALHPGRVLGAALVALIVVPMQITFQALKQAIGPVVGFRADLQLERLDVLIHGRPAWQWLTAVIDRPALVGLLDLLYACWFGGVIVFVLWASWSRVRAVRQRALVACALLWIVAGTAGAWLAPSAGPCYYGEVTGDARPFGPLLTTLDSAGGSHGLLARQTQQWLWAANRSGRWDPFGGVSAMPSMHVGMAVLFALVAWELSPLAGALLGVYAALIQLGSVVLAWHYAVDGYASAILAVLCWACAARLTVRRSADF